MMTLDELAKKLNLSASTVSRALSRPEVVAEATRERVLTAVKAYNYRPNGVARSLRKGNTRTVGLVVSDIQNPFYSTVVRAVEHVASQQGYSVVIFNADEKAESEATALDLLSEMQVSGIILGPTGANLDLLRRLSGTGIPIVEIDRSSGLKDADSVLIDNRQGAHEAAKYLLNQGHRRFAVITGPLHLLTGFERLKGFELALSEAGLALPEENIEVGDFREASGYAAAQRLLALAEPPTALFVANNEMMAGALAALREQKIRIPEDISLISFDDVRWAKYVEPPLTVVAQPTEQIGTTAAHVLFRRLEGNGKPEKHILKPTLIVRASCGPPPS